MKAPLRSHGFDKPSDLDDHLAELDEEAEAIAAEAKTEKPRSRGRVLPMPSIRRCAPNWRSFANSSTRSAATSNGWRPRSIPATGPHSCTMSVTARIPA